MQRGLVDPQRVELDLYLEAYEAAQTREGQADPAVFLPPQDHPLYGAVLRELVRIDMELGWERGRPQRLAEYQQRFPRLARDQESLQAVAFEEYRLRRQAGENPRPEEYRQCYGVATDTWPQSKADGRRHDSGQAAEQTTPRLPEVGTRFLDFELCAELGEGAFAKVFLARQSDLGNRYVALKMSSDIVDETRVLVQLQHTHIVPVYSVHRSGPLQAICMPYFGSSTLADVLQKLRGSAGLPESGKALVATLATHKRTTRQADNREEPAAARAVSAHHQPVAASASPLPSAWVSGTCSTTLLEALGKLTYVEAVLWLAARLADGLAHAHERGIVHRDLKPANVLLTEEGQPMILDFNLSEDIKRRGVAGAVVGGTLPYMAPEQLEAFQGEGQPAEARGDVYALGVILYELLTGRQPFPVRSGVLSEVLAAMRADRTRPPPEVRRWNPAVTPAVESIVRHCLETDLGRRYQNAAQLREDVQRHLDNLPLRYAPDPSGTERVRKWLRRHPRLSSMTAVASCAAVVVVVLLSLLVVRSWQLGRLEALEARQQLGKDLKAIQFHLSRPDAEPQQHAEGLALCRRAAERYGLPDVPFTQAALGRALPAEEREQLRTELGELLLAWARGLAWQAAAAQNHETRQEQIQLALRLTTRAEECYGPAAVPSVLWLERARLSGLAGDEAEAQRLRARAAASSAATPRERFLLLLHQAGQGLAPETLNFLREASLRDSQNYSVWLVLGNCHAALGQRIEAAAYYDIGIALAPDEPWAYFNRGLLHLEGDKPAQASDDFDQVIRLRPHMIEAYFNRALAKLALNRLEDALADLNHLVESTPLPPTRVFFVRARVRAKSGDVQGMGKDRQEGLRRAPTDEHDCVARGMARVATDPEGALADFELALTFNPRSRRALQNQAGLLAEKLGKPAKAVEILDRLLTLHPDAPLALAGRGVLHARLGSREAAHRDGQAALKLNRGPALLYQVAGIYALTSRQQPADRQPALQLLADALRQGHGYDLLARDTDLAPLHDHEQFQRWLEVARTLPR